MKKYVSILFVLILGITISLSAGCGNKDKNTEKHYVFSACDVLSDENRAFDYNSVNRCNICVWEDSFFYLTTEKDENSTSTYVNRYDVETGQATELFEIDKSDVSPGTSINGLKAISEDDIKIIIGNILQTYSMKGELKSSVKIEASIENAAQICIDKVGNIFTTVFDDNSRKLCIYKFDSTGKKIAENSVNFYPTKMVLDNKDRLIIRYEEGETTVTSGIQYFDAATLEAIEKEAEFDAIDIFGGDTSNTFYMSDGINLITYSDETSKKEEILGWTETGIIGMGVEYLAPFGKDRFLCMFYNGDSIGEPEYAMFGIIDEKQTNTVEKKVITVVCGDTASSLEKKIIDFNRQNENIQVEYKSYYNTDMNFEQSLYMDLFAGETPDIIILDGVDIKRFISNGFLLNLDSYIEKDDTVNKDYFLDGILDALKTDGKNYFLCNSVSIDALVGKRSELNKFADGWTAHDMISYYKSKDKDVELFFNNSKQKMAYILIGEDLNHYIDWANGTCSFDGAEFKELLEFCNSFKNGEEEYDWQYDERIKPIEEGKLLFETATLDSPFSAQVYRTMFGGDEMYLGYPRSEGSAKKLNINLSAGILATSKHPDEAWEFLKQIVMNTTEESGEFDTSILVSVKDFDIYTQALKDNFKGKTFNYNFINVGAPTDEDIKVIKENIKEAQYDTLCYEKYNIIREDIMSYFSGEHSLEDTVAIIQDKMMKYVNENK